VGLVALAVIDVRIGVDFLHGFILRRRFSLDLLFFPSASATTVRGVGWSATHLRHGLQCDTASDTWKK
jgi:hypothetical protein